MVSVGGLASGLDTNGIINQLIELERRPITSLQADIAELQQVQATFTGLATNFASLNAASASLALDSLNAPTVAVGTGTETALTVTADSTAVVGSHDILISQLATSSRLASQGFADSDSTPISGVAGNFTIQSGTSGAQISIAVTTSSTMEDLAQGINAADGDITASIIQDGTNALSSRLVLTSSQTGSDKGIRIVANTTNLDFTNNVIEAASADSSNAGAYTGTVSSSGTYTGTANKSFVIEILTGGAVGAATYRVSEDGGVTFDNNGGLGYTTSAVAGAVGSNTEGVNIDFSAGGTLTAGDTFHIDVSNPTLSQAQDAVFTLDGITQTRSTNSITDALQGVTLNLASTSTSISFSVSRDDSTIVSAVDSFVEAYNEVYTAIRNEQTFDSDTFEAGILLGDRTANSILSQLRSTVSRQSALTGSVFDSLASLGITSSRTGGLSVDSSQLQSALTRDRDGVLAVLASTETSSTSLLNVSARPREREDGTYAVSVTTVPQLASSTAGGAQTDTLGGAEVLSFVYSANNTEASPTTSSFSVSLQAGDTLAQVIDRLNSAFATQGVGLTAFSNSNVLTIQSTEYGADQFFSVVSDTASGANTTRVGTGLLSSSGVDIVGTIDNQSSTGTGNRLEVNDGQVLDDLAITYTGTGTGIVGSITVSSGAGDFFADLVDDLNSGSSSVIGVRNASLQEQIDALEERIVDREEQVARTQARLEAQFAALEVQLAGLQSQADFLTNQLAQLSSIGQRES